MPTLKEELLAFRDEVAQRLESRFDSDALARYEFEVLGRKGGLAVLVKKIAFVAPEAKPEIGRLINEVKSKIEHLFFEKKASQTQERVSEEAFDVTLPGIPQPMGSLHIVSRAIDEIERIFIPLGFSRVGYNEVEWDYYAFEALNMPIGHPARDEWETFFISEKPVAKKGRVLLTPHTSSGQVREMEKHSANDEGVRMINIAKCYRRQIDISHLPMFHQFEGLAVGRTITMQELIGTIKHFVKNFFGKDRDARLRPYHFRFTEPSFEIDIT